MGFGASLAYSRDMRARGSILLTLTLFTACETSSDPEDTQAEASSSESEESSGETSDEPVDPVAYCESFTVAEECSEAGLQDQDVFCAWLEPVLVVDPCSGETQPAEPTCVAGQYFGDGCIFTCEMDNRSLSYRIVDGGVEIASGPGCGVGALGEWAGGVPMDWTFEQQECACALF